MKYLAIDTSGDYLTVICKNGEKTAIHYSKMPGVKHSQSLMPIVEEVLNEAQLVLSDADFFAAATGPGSFTGIRIGVATIKGLADALNKPVLAVTTLQALAYTESTGKRLAVIDAKHDHFYVEGYDGLTSVYQPAYVSKETLTELSKTYKLLANGPIDGFLCENVNVAQGLNNAVELLQENISDDVNSLHPFYLRLSQAEEGRK